jgi:hypothetical protein
MNLHGSGSRYENVSREPPPRSDQKVLSRSGDALTERYEQSGLLPDLLRTLTEIEERKNAPPPRATIPMFSRGMPSRHW